MIAIYEKHREVITNYLLHMTGDPDLADEVFCATFAAFFQTIERYEPRGRLMSYLLRIAHTKLADERKSRKRFGGSQSVHVQDKQLLSKHPLPDELAIAGELREKIADALGRLPKHLREVVILRLYENLDYETIGSIVDAGEATVRSRMRYALQTLRQWFSASDRRGDPSSRAADFRKK